jgi:hypothetical protein
VNFRICTPIIRRVLRSIAWAAQGSRPCQFVSRANVHQLLGIVTFDDVLAPFRVPRNLHTANRDEE